MSKEAKRTIIFTVILTIIALVLAIVFIVGKLKEAGIIATAESKEILEEIDKNYNSSERTVIYYASSNCPYCDQLTPILEEIADEYDMDYYYVDSTKLSKGQKNRVKKQLNIEGKTPTTVIVENGEVIDTKVGLVDGTEYVEFLKEGEVLPESAVYGEEKNITFVDYDEYDKLISSKGTHIIVVGQTSCPHCIAIKPALNTVAGEYNLTINYLNLTEISNEENRLFFESLDTIGYDDEEYLAEGSIGTPLVLIVKDGKVTNYFSGEKTTSQLVRQFKKYGLISD